MHKRQRYINEVAQLILNKKLNILLIYWSLQINHSIGMYNRKEKQLHTILFVIKICTMTILISPSINEEPVTCRPF